MANCCSKFISLRLVLFFRFTSVPSVTTEYFYFSLTHFFYIQFVFFSLLALIESIFYDKCITFIFDKMFCGNCFSVNAVCLRKCKFALQTSHKSHTIRSSNKALRMQALLIYNHYIHTCIQCSLTHSSHSFASTINLSISVSLFQSCARMYTYFSIPL